jgi:hypothetical protein
MLTDDEKSKFDDRYFDAKNNKAPTWKEIETLLNFAEQLKTKCDYSYDRIFLLDSLQFFSVFTIFPAFFLIIELWQKNNRGFIIAAYYSSTEFTVLLVAIGFLLLSCLFLVFSKMYLQKIRRRIKSDLRALSSIVDLLRENFNPLTADLSDLQKIQLKIHMSRFDIDMKSSIPTPLIMNLIKILFPFLTP